MFVQSEFNGRPKSSLGSLTAAAFLAVLFWDISYNAHAETLYNAFTSAFDRNEVLGSQRAAVRVGAQDKVIAQTGYAPALTGTTDYGYENLKGQSPSTGASQSRERPRGYGLNFSQNIFNGFKTSSTVKREDASLRAERDKLGDVEQRVLIDVATAYVDVLRDKAIIELRRHDQELLESRAKQTRYRFQIGDLTRTDVDQSEAALARARADLVIAETNLQTSAANFQAVVGRDPGALEPAGVPERLLPRDLGAAITIAQDEHPAILAAIGTVRAAAFNIDVERAAFMPSLDLTASVSHRWDPDYYPAKTDLTTGLVVGRLTIPLYDRGLTYASVHRANEVKTEREMELDHQRAEIRASVIQNRGMFLASRSVIASADAQIAASDRALYGVELEETAGQRTLLDVLTAQRSLLDARVNREIAQHDRIIAGYRFLASIGRLALSRLTEADTRGRAVPPASRRRPDQGSPLERFPQTWRRDRDVTARLDRGSSERNGSEAPALAEVIAVPRSVTSTVVVNAGPLIRQFGFASTVHADGRSFAASPVALIEGTAANDGLGTVPAPSPARVSTLSPGALGLRPGF